MSDETEAEKQRGIEELDRQIAIRHVSLESGIPAGMLSNATSEEEARAQATEALAWRGDQPAAPPQTAAVSQAYSRPGQISRQTLAHLSPEQVMSVYRQNRLDQVGAPAPGPRQNGGH